MEITAAQLLRILPNAGARAAVFVSLLNAAMKRRQIITRARVAAFLAQIGHESGELKLIRVSSKKDYQIQSLILFGDLRLLEQPELLDEPRWAVESAALHWMHGGFNELADAGKFKLITQRINGGLNGYAERLKIWARAREVLA